MARAPRAHGNAKREQVIELLKRTKQLSASNS